MKLATLRDGSRDGQLIVVSRDLARAHHATAIAGRLQAVLEDWNFLSPQLEDLSASLNQGKLRHAFKFDPRDCMAALPRAYQSAWAGGWPSDRQAAPLALGPGDGFLGPTDAACFAGDEPGIDCEPGIAAITGDLPQACTPAQGIAGVRLLMLANGWRLRTPGHADASLVFAPATAFGPVAVTTDELGEAWLGGRLHLNLDCSCHGADSGPVLMRFDTAAAMPLHFGQLIALLAGARRVRAGSLIGNVVGNIVGNPVSGRAALRFGDRVRLEMSGRDGVSVFGAIEQTLGKLP